MWFLTKKSKTYQQDSYLKKVRRRANRQEWLNVYFFGFGFGDALMFTFLARWLFNRENIEWDKYYLAFAGVGALIVLLTIFAPVVTRYLQRGFSWVLAKVGWFILSSVLAVIYLIWFIPVGSAQQAKQRQEAKLKTTWQDIV